MIAFLIFISENVGLTLRSRLKNQVIENKDRNDDDENVVLSEHLVSCMKMDLLVTQKKFTDLDGSSDENLAFINDLYLGGILSIFV